jgi:peptidoglycan hydrolase CwlO-like protein
VRPRTTALAVFLALTSFAAPGGAQDAEDPWEARQRVRDEQEALEGELDVLRVQDDELAAALVQLDADLASAQADLDEAERLAAQAEARLADAEAAVRRTEAEIEALEAQLRRLAVEAYMGSGSANRVGSLLGAEDLNQAAQRMTVIDVVAVDVDTVIDALEDTRARLAAAQRRADDAARVAEARRAAASEHLAMVTDARDTRAAYAAEVAVRIEARLAESAALEALDAELSARVRAEQEALAAALAAAGGAGGGAGAAGGAVSLVDPADLRPVRGITVHESVAAQLEAMLAAAEEDGIVLSGWGHRSSASQISLREQHCPDVWSSPPSTCTPPTARPGTSLHERGLAVDITYEGSTIQSHDSPAFRWLAEHAEMYGFYNLPSEPWHRSTTGG